MDAAPSPDRRTGSSSRFYSLPGLGGRLWGPGFPPLWAERGGGGGGHLPRSGPQSEEKPARNTPEQTVSHARPPPLLRAHTPWTDTDHNYTPWIYLPGREDNQKPYPDRLIKSQRWASGPERQAQQTPEKRAVRSRPFSEPQDTCGLVDRHLKVPAPRRLSVSLKSVRRSNQISLPLQTL